MTSLFLIFALCFLPNVIHSSIPFFINPDCDIPSCKDFSQGALYYGNHIIGEKKIHMIYSSYHELTIMVMETDKTASPQFNYTALQLKNYTGAFKFPDAGPYNSLTLVIRRLMEFNDPDDTGLLHDNQRALNSYLLSDFPINNLTSANNNTDRATFEYLLGEVRIYFNLSKENFLFSVKWHIKN